MEFLVHTVFSNALASTVLAVIATCLARSCRRPALTHSLWLLVMVKLITPPIVPIALPISHAIAPAQSFALRADVESDLVPGGQAEMLSVFPDSDSSVTSHPEAPRLEVASGPAEPMDIPPAATVDRRPVDPLVFEASPASAPSTGWRWEHVILAIILAGAAGWWTLATVRIVLFQRVLFDLQPVLEVWQSQTDDMAKRMGLSQCPRLYLVPGRVPPMLWAIGGKPRLLVPSQLWESMEEDERTSLVLHELAHLKRRDHWVRWLELIVAGLYWWHPVAWWARRQLREAEEQCCDAWVVWAMPHGAKTYAAALLAALEFVSGARTAPAAASATSGNGHLSCLKRRFRMIVRAKTPKSLSWAGRIAVLALATLLLPLAPSWAHPNTLVPAGTASFTSADDSKPSADAQPSLGVSQRANEALEQRVDEEFRKDPDVAELTAEIQKIRDHLEQNKREVRQPNDPSRVAAAKHLKKLADLYDNLRTAKRDELLAQLSKDKAKGDDDKDEKTRDAVERFQDQLTDLIGKLGKELGPVTEEVRKALERAVGEVHKSLEKEGVSAEDLGKALEKSQEELRKAFDSGGPINKELRDAIERSRDEVQDAVESARGLIEDQVETLRQNSAELADRARENLDRAQREAEDASRNRGGQERLDRRELENARREIRELEQQLRRATRRLEELERQETRRLAPPRREPNPRASNPAQARPARPADPAASAEPAPSAAPAPSATPAPARAPEPPVPPVAATRPAPPNVRRPQPGNRPIPRGMRSAQGENDKRLKDLEEKMNQLLKELESLKDEKSPK